MVNLKILKDIDKKLYFMFLSIQKYYFKCSSCGACCTYKDNIDNTVYIRYDEIIKISKNYNIPFDSIVSPFYPDVITYKKKYGIYYIKKYLKKLKEQIDNNVNIHIFGWKLKKKSDGNCIFYNKSTKKCLIYKSRPSLCYTYPYYIDIDTFKLKISFCNNIMKKHQETFNIKLFFDIINRYINDLKDIKLIENNTKKINKSIYLNSKEGLFKAYINFIKGYFKFIVYDQ